MLNNFSMEIMLVISYFSFIGALIGSFLNVLSLRWAPKLIANNDSEAHAWLTLRGIKIPPLKPSSHLPLMMGRSKCPKCDASIPLYLNIPLVSWLMLRGRSSCCKQPIALRYLGWEIVGAIVMGLSAFVYGVSFGTVILGAMVLWLLLIAQIDFREGFIADEALVGLAILIYGFSYFGFGNPLESVFAWHIATFIVLWCVCKLYGLVRGQDGMATADIHLLSLSAGLLGGLFLQSLIVVAVLIVVTAIIFQAKNIERGVFINLVNKNAIPGAPAICISMIIMLSLIILKG